MLLLTPVLSVAIPGGIPPFVITTPEWVAVSLPQRIVRPIPGRCDFFRLKPGGSASLNPRLTEVLALPGYL